LSPDHDVGVKDRESGGQVAVVTGSARGLGHAIAEHLAGTGLHVVLTSRRAEDARRAAEQMRLRGLHADPCRLDVRREADMRRVGDEAAAMGRVAVWVNNAGYWTTGRASVFPSAEWDELVATNLTGAFLGCQEAIRQMSDSGGVIVNIASIIGLVGLPGRAAYAASKAGLIGLTKTLAAEVGAAGIRVNAVAPGFVEGDAGPEDGADYRVADIVRRTPTRRFVDRADVAEAVSFLVRTTSVNGAVLVVDGGWVADGSWHTETT
jgi:3-oxoacyl-[acyl-carrier protein] reductase